MKILIIGAMVEEVEYLVGNFDFETIDTINFKKLYKLKDLDIYLLNSGIGKVTSSISLSMFLNKYNIDQIISIGSSGSLNINVKIGDIVCARALAYHDVDISYFGYEIGQLPDYERFFKTSTSSFFEKILSRYKKSIRVHEGLIVTGDQFVSVKQRNKVSVDFPEALAVEMESCAMVHTANTYDININVLRVISDNAADGAEVEFDKFLKNVCIQYEKLLNIIIDEI